VFLLTTSGKVSNLCLLAFGRVRKMQESVLIPDTKW
jgi:hypothetical protein